MRPAARETDRLGACPCYMGPRAVRRLTVIFIVFALGTVAGAETLTPAHIDLDLHYKRTPLHESGWDQGDRGLDVQFSTSLPGAFRVLAEIDDKLWAPVSPGLPHGAGSAYYVGISDADEAKFYTVGGVPGGTTRLHARQLRHDNDTETACVYDGHGPGSRVTLTLYSRTL